METHSERNTEEPSPNGEDDDLCADGETEHNGSAEEMDVDGGIDSSTGGSSSGSSMRRGESVASSDVDIAEVGDEGQDASTPTTTTTTTTTNTTTSTADTSDRSGGYHEPDAIGIVLQYPNAIHTPCFVLLHCRWISHSLHACISKPTNTRCDVPCPNFPPPILYTHL